MLLEGRGGLLPQSFLVFRFHRTTCLHRHLPTGKVIWSSTNLLRGSQKSIRGHCYRGQLGKAPKPKSEEEERRGGRFLAQCPLNHHANSALGGSRVSVAGAASCSGG